MWGGQCPAGGTEGVGRLGFLQKAGLAVSEGSGVPLTVPAGTVAMQGMHSTVAETAGDAPPRAHESAEKGMGYRGEMPR